MFGFIHVRMNDQQFAAWLRRKDPNWSWSPVGRGTNYIANGVTVAVAIYNNTTCTREIYVKEGC